jgi:membrane protein implicated in regulation of membrane protease activity
VLLVYIAALVVAAGVLGFQLALGHHGLDSGGHDAAHDTGHDTTVWTFVASLRFWAFALLAFGLVGTLIHVFGFAGALVTALIATGCGVVSGVVAVSVIRRLTQRTETSHATAGDVVGRVGRVIVPPNEEGRCKVRVEIKGSMIDYVAEATEPMSEGDAVLVEDSGEGARVRVSRAPKELKP